jgi:formylglycine-generating enzyme required for sulfatase activity
VRLDSFWIDITEVTNAQFLAFVGATGYVTTTEQPPRAANWRQPKRVPTPACRTPGFAV